MSDIEVSLAELRKQAEANVTPIKLSKTTPEQFGVRNHSQIVNQIREAGEAIARALEEQAQHHAEQEKDYLRLAAQARAASEEKATQAERDLKTFHKVEALLSGLNPLDPLE